jgi:uncharacterized protein YjiS (DUF1127 family)
METKMFFSAFADARRRRLAAQDLRRLTDTQLLDIGIEPGRIEEAVAAMPIRPLRAGSAWVYGLPGLDRVSAPGHGPTERRTLRPA